MIAFVLATVYPLLHFGWLRYQKGRLPYPLQTHYSNRYHEVFFRFVHRDIWSEGSISYAEQFYNIYRFG